MITGKKLTRVLLGTITGLVLLATSCSTPVGPTSSVVYGTPVYKPAPAYEACDYPNVGYIVYSNTSNPSGGWYLNTVTQSGVAYDAHPGAQTSVYYSGAPPSNWGCSTNIPPSKWPYHFRVYFKDAMPADPAHYELTLKNFKVP